MTYIEAMVQAGTAEQALREAGRYGAGTTRARLVWAMVVKGGGLPVRVMDLSEWTGIARPHVSAELAKAVGDGLVRVVGERYKAGYAFVLVEDF
jgi:hypothetical protein